MSEASRHETLRQDRARGHFAGDRDVRCRSSDDAAGDDAGPRDIPAPFAPFEYLVGRWNGQGVPKDNPAQQFRGWTEKHTWAWKFAQGKPVGLTLAIEGGKILASGTLTYEPASKSLRLEGIEPGPAERYLVFEGTLDKTGKHLVLDHTEAGVKAGKPTGTMRLSMWPNANFIRYTMAHDLKEAGSVQFTRLIEVGLTKDGESLGGAATFLRSAQVHRDRRGGHHDPDLSGPHLPDLLHGLPRRIQRESGKVHQEGQPDGGTRPANPGPANPPRPSVGRFEDAFANDVVDSPSQAKPAAGRVDQDHDKSPVDPGPNLSESNTSTTKIDPTKDDEHSALAKQASRRRLDSQAGPEPRKGRQHRRGSRLLPTGRQGLCQDARRQDRGGADQGARGSVRPAGRLGRF